MSRPEPALAYSFVTIEARPDRQSRERWEAVLWDDGLVRVASACGSSPQQAMVNAALRTALREDADV